MKIFNKKLLEEFAGEHLDVQAELSSWVYTIENTKRGKAHKLESIFPGAQYLGNGRYSLSFDNGMYRVIALLLFSYDIVIIRFVGMFDESMEIDYSII